MTFQKGASGNPGGRPPGSTEATKYRKLLESKSDVFVNKLLELAESGSPMALMACIDRLIPKLKPVAAGVNVGRLEGTLAEQGQVIISAMGKGQLSPDDAQTMLSAIASQMRIIEVDELVKRIEALEGAKANER